MFWPNVKKYFQKKINVMQTESQTTIHALYRLIEEGCSATSNSERTLQLQKAILKKFFKASDVEITHLQNEVSIVMRPMLSDARSTEINLEIPKKQFSGFLQNCIKNDTKGEVFYINMMRYFAAQR